MQQLDVVQQHTKYDRLGGSGIIKITIIADLSDSNIQRLSVYESEAPRGYTLMRLGLDLSKSNSRSKVVCYLSR